MTGVTELLAECDALGIRLLPAVDGGLTIDAPHNALTPAHVDRLKSQKAELLALLQTGDTPASLALIDRTPISADGKWHTVYDKTHGESDWINGAFDSNPGAIKPDCRCHKEQRWWRSIYGDHLICGICHPPVSPEVFREWVHEESNKTN
jgi:hypothetical protein